MAPSNAEVIRDQYAATNERDWDRANSYYAEDVVLVIHGEGIRSGTFEGREALGRWFGEWFSTFDSDARFEIREIIEREDGSVLVFVDHHARGRSSGVEVHGAVAWLYSFGEGKIVRLEGNASIEGNFRRLQEMPVDDAVDALRGQSREHLE